MNDRIDLGPAFPPFDSVGRHRTFGVCGRACDVLLQLLPVPNLASTVAMRESRHRPSARRADSRLPCPGEAVNPLRFFGRGALRRGRGRRRRRRRAGRTMVLSRKARERALMGRRSGSPRARRRTPPRRQAAPRRAASPGIPKAQFTRRVHGPNPTPPISPGTAGVLAGIVDDGAPPRPVARQPRPVRAPVGRRLSQWPRARFARAGEDAGAPRGIARRAHARPRPVIPELSYPGCAGVPPASREARHADGSYPEIAHPQFRIREPRRFARLSRNSPVPEARPPRIPQIPQVRIPQSRIREPHGPARLSRNSRNRPPRIPQIPQVRIPQSRIREPHGPARLSRNSRNRPPAIPERGAGPTAFSVPAARAVPRRIAPPATPASACGGGSALRRGSSCGPSRSGRDRTP